MQLSSDRILTTHTGSLPRPAGLSLTGPERDAEQLADAVRSVVTSQIDAGVDVVNDGEASKVGYSTYVTERLTGFGGEGEPLRPKDYDDFPAWGERMMSERARSRRLTNPACIGPVAYDDTSLVQADIDNLKQATAGQDVADVFMSAASPGVIAVFLANKYYAERRGVHRRAGRRDEDRVRRDPRCGPGAAARLPGPGHGLERVRHRRHAGGVPRRGRPQGGRDQPRAPGTSRPRRCGCTCAGATTRARTPATSRCARSSARCSRPGRPRSRSRAPTPATSTSGPCSRTSSCRTARPSSRA